MTTIDVATDHPYTVTIAHGALEWLPGAISGAAQVAVIHTGALVLQARAVTRAGPFMWGIASVPPHERHTPSPGPDRVHRRGIPGSGCWTCCSAGLTVLASEPAAR